MAVAEGFEPSDGGYPSHAFEACSLGRSDTPPRHSLPNRSALTQSLPGEELRQRSRALFGQHTAAHLRAVGEPIFGMDATRISMARLLNYLFEVTERFGMETRTELILLQRTMVVVEGVARSLDPHINIWDVARPVVEDYIAKNIGPQATARDLLRTLRVMGRFGPLLPRMVERALIQQAHRNDPALPPLRRIRLVWGAAGLAAGLALAAAAHLLT